MDERFEYYLLLETLERCTLEVFLWRTRVEPAASPPDKWKTKYSCFTCFSNIKLLCFNNIKLLFH